MSSYHKKLSVEGLKAKAEVYQELIVRNIDEISNLVLLEDCLAEIRRKENELCNNVKAGTKERP